MYANTAVNDRIIWVFYIRPDNPVFLYTVPVSSRIMDVTAGNRIFECLLHRTKNILF